MHVPGAQYGGSVDDFTFPEWRRNLCTVFFFFFDRPSMPQYLPQINCGILYTLFTGTDGYENGTGGGIVWAIETIVWRNRTVIW